jgi:hypothetical protein
MEPMTSKCQLLMREILWPLPTDAQNSGSFKVPDINFVPIQEWWRRC